MDKGPQDQEEFKLDLTKGGSQIIRGPKPTPQEVASDTKTECGQFQLSREEIEKYRLGDPIIYPYRIPETEVIFHEIEDEDTGGTRDITLGIAYDTLQGKNPKPPHKPNQDSILVSTFIKEKTNMHMFSVFDGHGPYGEHASHFMRMKQLDLLTDHESFEEDPVKAFSDTTVRGHKAFCEAEGTIDQQVSGAVLTSCLLSGHHLYTLNVGDSRAILISRDHYGTFTIEPLSEDHKPQLKLEKERLLANGAILRSEREVRGAGDPKKWYICRQKDGEIIYGILFTRSIGDSDAHENLGIISEGDLHEHELMGIEQYLIMATDGVWDYIHNEEILDIIQEIVLDEEEDLGEHMTKPIDSKRLVDAIMEQAKTHWKKEDIDGRRDDISIVCVSFDWDVVEKKKTPSPSKNVDENEKDGKAEKEDSAATSEEVNVEVSETAK